MGEPDLRIADEHATGRVPTARPEQTVGEVRDSLAGADFDCADDVAVVADCALLGRGSLGGYLASTRGGQAGGRGVRRPPPLAPPSLVDRGLIGAMASAGLGAFQDQRGGRRHAEHGAERLAVVQVGHRRFGHRHAEGAAKAAPSLR
jgi:hypothetical protein